MLKRGAAVREAHAKEMRAAFHRQGKQEPDLFALGAIGFLFESSLYSPSIVPAYLPPKTRLVASFLVKEKQVSNRLLQAWTLMRRSTLRRGPRNEVERSPCRDW